MTRRHLTLFVVAVTAISSAAVLIRLADAPPFAIVFYRCAFAAVILVPVALLRHREEFRRLTPARWRLALVSGALLGIHFSLWVWSLSYTSIAAAAVLVATEPLWVGLLGRFVGERPVRRTWIGLAIALAGIVLISGTDFGGGGRALLGDLLALGGALAGAAYVLAGRTLRQELSVVTYAGIAYTAAAAVAAAGMFAGGTNFAGYDPEVWLLFAVITAGPQFLGHTVFNFLLGHVRASVVALGLMMEPVGATILALLVLSEVPGVLTVLGGVVVLTGVWVAIAAEASRRPELLEAPPE